MKTPLIVVMSGLLLAGGGAARQTGTKDRQASVTADASRQARASLLKAQLAAWQKIRGEEWTEAQRKKKEYDQYVRSLSSITPIDLNPTRVVDRSAAEAQQAAGRVEAADLIIKDVERRLTELGPAAPRQAHSTPWEAAVATLAEKEVENALLSDQQAAWQRIRADEWEAELRLKRVYEEYARQHPDYPVDRSGAEANVVVGRVEALDRFLAGTTNRLAALEPEIKAARAALKVPAGPAPLVEREYWDADKKIVKREYEFVLDSGRKIRQGKERVYFASGKLSYEATRKDNALDGSLIRYWENGQKFDTALYKAGSRYGEYAAFCSDGKPRTQGQFSDDRKVGAWKTYYTNGKLETEGSYPNESRTVEKVGAAVASKPDADKGLYYDWGTKVGPWKFYYVSGRKQREDVYDDDGSTTTKDGKLVGPSRTYYDNAANSLESESLPSGFTSWYENGQVKEKCPVNGKCRRWNQDGTEIKH